MRRYMDLLVQQQLVKFISSQELLNESEIKNNASLRMIQPLYPKILKNWEWTDINTEIKVPLYKILREFTGNPNVRRCLVDIQNKLKNTKNIKDSLCRNMSQKISSKSITNQL